MESSARQLLRAIRGKRSQVAFSRRLGYRSNVVADWETGRRFPTGAEMLRACTLARIDVIRALSKFAAVGVPILSALPRQEGLTPQVLAQWLDALRGKQTLASLAVRCQTSRYAVGRWLSGQTQPRLPDFLLLVEALTGRVADLLAQLVPIELIPALLAEQRQRMTLRELAVAQPWTEAILRVLETKDYQSQPKHTNDWIAGYLRIDASVVHMSLSLLHAAGVLRLEEGKYFVQDILTVDTKSDPASFSALQAHWAKIVTERIFDRHADDITSYNVFSCSRADFARIRELHREYYHQVRAIVAASEPIEVVGLLSTALLSWKKPVK